MLPALLVVLSAWPSDGAGLHPPELPAAQGRNLRVYVDAGHGAPGNTGNTGCRGQLEEGHTLAVAKHLAFVLSALGPFEVSLSRDGPGAKYAARLAEAQRVRADVIISLHSDTRGEMHPWWPNPGGTMQWQSQDDPGFTILWSEEGRAATVSARQQLGRAVGLRLRTAGFLPSAGGYHESLYLPDPQEVSAWVDNRPHRQRVYFLRGSTIPTVIIETHHAMDPREVARWEEGKTVDVFSLAVAAALLDWSRERPALADAP